jgi:hypothetical protein
VVFKKSRRVGLSKITPENVSAVWRLIEGSYSAERLYLFCIDRARAVALCLATMQR